MLIRRSLRAILGAWLAAGLVTVTPVETLGTEPGDTVVAYVDGREIPVEDIPRYYCDDFSYPVIQCTRLPLVAQSRAVEAAMNAEVDYVTVYEYPNYAGPFMHISQDYAALATVGWNDRVSSFRGRNAETGRFNADWFHGGSTWLFCCNAMVASLGSQNNTFSSVRRT